MHQRPRLENKSVYLLKLWNPFILPSQNFEKYIRLSKGLSIQKFKTLLFTPIIKSFDVPEKKYRYDHSFFFKEVDTFVHLRLSLIRFCITFKINIRLRSVMNIFILVLFFVGVWSLTNWIKEFQVATTM